MEGLKLGVFVTNRGDGVGGRVGCFDGCVLGDIEGSAVGCIEGLKLGVLVGCCEGRNVGLVDG